MPKSYSKLTVPNWWRNPAIRDRRYMFGRYFFAAQILLATASAQEPSPGPLGSEQSQRSPGLTCLEPPPVVRFEDYNGPFAKFAGTFARKLERKAVELPH
jgi:hypothetical protein